MTFENGKKYQHGDNKYVYIGKLGDYLIFNNIGSDEIVKFNDVVASQLTEFKEPKEFTFHFYLHAGEKFPLENYEICEQNLTQDQLNDCKYFCSEVKLGIKFSDGVFTLLTFDGIDVSDKNIELLRI